MRNECPIFENIICNRELGKSKDVFIMTTSEQWSAIGEVIKRTLRKHLLGPYVPTREEKKPGKEIFCTSICTKIIEAPFCISIMTKDEVASKKGKDKRGNPNVYLEFGKAQAWKKDVILIANNSDDLEFDVQGLSTILYDNDLKELEEKLDTVVQELINRLGLSSVPREEQVDPRQIEALEFFMEVVRTKTDPEALSVAANLIYNSLISGKNVFFDMATPFIIEHLTHDDENVQLKFMEALELLMGHYQVRDPEMIEVIRNRSIPVLLDRLRPGERTIAPHILRHLYHVGDERFIEEFVNILKYTEEEEYKDLRAEQNIKRFHFFKEFHMTIVAELLNVLEENEDVSTHNRTRIKRFAREIGDIYRKSD